MAKQRTSPMQAILAGVVVAVLVSHAPELRGQVAATADQIKAAYVFNFAKFVEWPPQTFPTPNAPINFCALGRTQTADEMDALMSGKSINGHAVKVRHLTKLDEIKDCQLLYIAAGIGRPEPLLRALKGCSVLVIGDTPGFAVSGGMIGFVNENGRVLFEVNPGAVEHSHLKISSKLLALARIVSVPSERGGQ